MDFEEFKNQSHRLLRMKWESPIGLAQELYTMLMDPLGTDIPAEEDKPRSIAVAEVQKRLKEAQDFFAKVGQPASAADVTATVTKSGFKATTTPLQIVQQPEFKPPTSAQLAPQPKSLEPPVKIEVSPLPLPDQPFLPSADLPAQASVINVLPPFAPYQVTPANTSGPFAYSRPDLAVKKPLPDVDWTVPIDNIPFGETSPGGGILGKVTGGKGDTYTVDLYEDGKNSPVTESAVTVKIPQIAPNDDIPDNTWIAPILEVTNSDGQKEFWYQPPIWL